MPRVVKKLVILVGASGLILIAAATPKTAPICIPLDDTANITLAHLRTLVTSLVPSDVALRDSLKISARRSSDVAYVTDEKTCAKAQTALNAVLSTPSKSRQLYVYKIGADFGVEDPTVGKDSEYRGLRIFDRSWVYKRTYLLY